MYHAPKRRSRETDLAVGATDRPKIVRPWGKQQRRLIAGCAPGPRLRPRTPRSDDGEAKAIRRSPRRGLKHEPKADRGSTLAGPATGRSTRRCVPQNVDKDTEEHSEKAGNDLHRQVVAGGRVASIGAAAPSSVAPALELNGVRIESALGPANSSASRGQLGSLRRTPSARPRRRGRQPRRSGDRRRLKAATTRTARGRPRRRATA